LNGLIVSVTTAAQAKASAQKFSVKNYMSGKVGSAVGSSVQNLKDKCDYSAANHDRNDGNHPSIQCADIGRVSSRIKLSATIPEAPVKQKADHRGDEKKTGKIVRQSERAVKHSRKRKSRNSIHQDVLW
jgi:hypothetical protein